MLAYLVLLRVEIARFTRYLNRLVSVALILTSRWTAVSCYAALCSPDLPPVRPFGPCTSGGLACFTGLIILETAVERARVCCFCRLWEGVKARHSRLCLSFCNAARGCKNSTLGCVAYSLIR